MGICQMHIKVKTSEKNHKDDQFIASSNETIKEMLGRFTNNYKTTATKYYI